MGGDPCKYVMLNKTEPVTFRKPIKHEDMKLLLLSSKTPFLQNAEITSAGFFMQTRTGAVIIPEGAYSTTLNLGPAPDDAVILEKFLRGER